MKDNDLIRVFLPIIQNALIEQGYTNVQVKQSNQPTLQGANTAPTVYFYKLSDKRYGFLYRKDEYDEIEEVMRHTEEQWYETSFQLQAWVRQRPITPNQYTASDLVNEVAAILQSDSTLSQLAANDIGILRIMDIRNPYYTDDRDEFEASPSFDFILTHRQTRITEIPVVDSDILNIKRV